MNPRLAFSFILAIWSFARPASPPPDAGRDLALEQALLHENDPSAAKSFLSDRERQQCAKTADPALFEKLFARALELKDLEELMVRGPVEPRPIRLGLSIRPNCVFCQNPVELLKWTDRYFDLDAAGRKVLRSAVWEWSELPKERQEWFAAKGETESAWSAHDFSTRQAKLEKWAIVERDALLQLSPRTREELEQMAARAGATMGVLRDDEVYSVSERVRRAALAVENAEAIRGTLSWRLLFPKRRKLLADLDAAPDLETRLSLLSKAFDGADAKSAAIRGAAPAQSGQTFDPQTREMVAKLLRSGLMRETAGTWAGDELKEFYVKVPLVVKVEKKDGSTLASYDEGVITFNEAEIERYVKSSGKTLKDLAGPALLEPLLRDLAPVFVHEATHHRQDVWAREQNIPLRSGHGIESEAQQVQALFVNEKMKRDPSYREFLDKTKTLSTNSREALTLANRLKENGPEWFRRTSMAVSYPEYFTIEANEWDQIWWSNDIGADLQRELLRRETLPAPERTALNSGPGFPEHAISVEVFGKLLPTFGTKFLLEELSRIHDRVADAPRIYAAYRDRLARSDALTLERMEMLESDTGQTRLRRRAEPPPPGNPTRALRGDRGKAHRRRL